MSTSSDKTKEKSIPKRAPMSCDRCKSRKTKCVNPLPGPCQLCASTGASCHVDMSRRRQRPYYQVSEEQFRYMAKALKHFLPDMALDLPNLREFVSNINDQSQLDRQELANSKIESPATSVSSGRTLLSMSEPSLMSTMAHCLDEIDNMQGRSSWLRVDNAGNHRYVGGQSSYAFDSVIQSTRSRQSSTSTDPDLLFSAAEADNQQLMDAALATSTPTSHRIYLPRRDLCNKSVARFFKDIHAVYWLFTTECFYSSLDSLYSGDVMSATPSMLCSLYSILALTCESEGKMYGSSNVSTSPSSRYLALAKELVPELYDKADINSIRALCLLAIVHQSTFPDQAYLYVGSAARIAYSLGLHIKKETHAWSMFQRQVELRIFCTIYLLDMDISLTHGYPPALSETDAVSDLHLTTEQILCPSSNIAPGYQVMASQLSRLARRISTLLYATPDTTRRTHSLTDVMGCVTALHIWMDDLPLPLRNCKDGAHSHGRSIAILHLRYYSTMVLATRPFLQHAALKSGEAGLEVKRKAYHDLAMLCIDAATQSLEIMQHMQRNDLLSSLVSLDTACLVENMHVFTLVVSANERNDSGLDVSQKAYTCLEILQSMEQAQGVKSALGKARVQLRQYGIIDASNGLVRKESPLEQLFLSMESPPALYLNSSATMTPGLPNLSDLHKLIFEELH
ncbi:hypothetical protein BROUX41_005627 [Berkeleyomyces rouxiae]|uniref:uncharacterized protein n=1 Tax=Berkeleyomyces rouxiae TaxID=2035830 RepID=UPI003B79E8DA